MKIRAQKQIIESILINLQPFLEKKDASQITSHILFTTEDNKCIVKKFQCNFIVFEYTYNI